MVLFNIDKTLNKIFNEAEEHFKGRVTREQIKEMYYFFWKYVLEDFQSFKYPSIKIPKFGRFIPSLTQLKKLRGIRDNLKKNKGFAEKLSNIEEVIERLELEKIKRKRK